MDDILSCKDITRGFRTADQTFWALKGVTMRAETGKLTILKGRSGSGKTTLINILGALDYPTGGDVSFGGKELSKLSENARDAIRRERMGFVFQSVALVSMMTAYENVEFGMRISGRFNSSVSERKRRAERMLALVGLSQRMRHLPQELSGGEQQRVAIARAIAHNPGIIFADEPTAELDTNTGLQVVKIFKDLIEAEGVTVLMTTHDPGFLDIADRVYELEDGELTDG